MCSRSFWCTHSLGAGMNLAGPLTMRCSTAVSTPTLLASSPFWHAITSACHRSSRGGHHHGDRHHGDRHLGGSPRNHDWAPINSAAEGSTRAAGGGRRAAGRASRLRVPPPPGKRWAEGEAGHAICARSLATWACRCLFERHDASRHHREKRAHRRVRCGVAVGIAAHARARRVYTQAPCWADATLSRHHTCEPRPMLHPHMCGCRRVDGSRSCSVRWSTHCCRRESSRRERKRRDVCGCSGGASLIYVRLGRAAND
mmetsp:Transcript_64366/g.192217  ORF Transcript_64366/g.192217 Transcript_64366/m.192217 type:complete len:257 (+) Transcript_64366:808-1578(+)